MTKEQVTQKIKEILSKDPRFKDADITVHFKSKVKSNMKQKGLSTLSLKLN